MIVEMQLPLARRRVLVTGAGGFIAGRLLPALTAADAEVHALVRRGGRPPAGPCSAVHHGELPDDAEAVVAAARPHAVVHLAVARADSSAAARLASVRVNVLGAAVLLEAAAAAGTMRFVHLGGTLEGVTAGGHYAATKAAASLLVGLRRPQCAMVSVTIRPSFVYGPGQPARRFIPTLLRAARHGGTVPLVAPDAARDWVHVDDVVAACLAAVAVPAIEHGAVAAVGAGALYSNREVVQLAREATGRSIETRLAATAPRPWDGASQPVDQRAALRLLGVAPRDLRTGLADTWTATA